MHWLTLLAEDVARTGSKAKTAARIGISRSAVSLALAGRYPAATDKLEAKVLEALAGMVPCPYDSQDIPRRSCRDRALRPMPMSSARELRSWTACQSCPHQPKEAAHGPAV
jgi:hypothetical protein